MFCSECGLNCVVECVSVYDGMCWRLSVIERVCCGVLEGVVCNTL